MPPPQAFIAKLRQKNAPRLQLVFLNGCDTASLGAQLRQRGVPHVVCWRTKAADAASRTLARAFFAALAKGRSVGEAYGDATQSVLAMATRRGVPLFMFCDPDADGEDAKTSPPYAAGVPVLLTVEGDDKSYIH